MILVEHSGQEDSAEAIQFCPFCQKLFMQEKALYKHIVQAHSDREYMSHTFHADLYARWQDRIPRLEQ